MVWYINKKVTTRGEFITQTLKFKTGKADYQLTQSNGKNNGDPKGYDFSSFVCPYLKYIMHLTIGEQSKDKNQDNAY